MPRQQEPEASKRPLGEALVARLTPLAAMARRMGAWAWQYPLKCAVIAVVLLAPVVPVLVLEMARPRGPTTAGAGIDPQLALDALDEGDVALAAELAESLGDGDLPPERASVAAYVLGVAADQRAAELMLASEERRLRVLAARYLKRSRSLGFPEGRKAEGQFLLAKNLYQSGQQGRSLPELRAALVLNPQRKTEVNRLLAGACLAATPPRLAEALAHNSVWSADAALPVEQQHEGLLERARIEFASNHFEDCGRTLAQIPKGSLLEYEALLIGGRILLERARALGKPAGGPPASRHPPEVVAAYQAAIAELRNAQGHDRSGLATTADSMYLIGICYLELGDHRAAVDQLQRTHQRYYETPAGFAAGFEAADLLRRMGRAKQAIAAYRGLLENLDDAQGAGAPWLGLAELRSRAVAAYQDLLKTGSFDRAAELAELLSALFPAERARQFLAESHAQWGRALVERSAALGGDDSLGVGRQGRRQLRTAGTIYRQLAEMRRTTRAYPQDMFQAAQHLLAGHDYTGAISAYEEYLEAESRRLHPQALLGLAQARLAQGRCADALVAVRELIDYHPKAASVFQGRLVGSQAYLELRNVKAAESMLLDNLNGDALTPASIEWQQSLFSLGRLLYHAGRYKEAIRKLEEAVARYPQSSDTIEARYLAAEAYRKSAALVQDEARTEATAEGRLARRREAERLLEAGLVRYEQERDALLAGLERGNLPPLEQATLRNCFFARGAVLFELGRYQEAIQAYASVTNRYQQAPEVLEAYVQIAACYRRLGQPIEAKSTLEQAKYALKHIPDGPSFNRTTNYDREEWSRMLDSLGTL